MQQKYYNIFVKRVLQPHGQNINLQNIILNVKNHVSNAKERKKQLDLFGEAIILLRIDEVENGLIVVYCLVNPSNKPGFLVPENQNSINISPIADDGQNKEYPYRASAVFISNNTVLSIGENTKHFIDCIKDISERHNLASKDALNFNLSQIAEQNQIEKIKKHGVRSLSFPVTGFLKNMSETSSLGNFLRANFMTNDAMTDEIIDSTSMSGRLNIFSGKKGVIDFLNEIATGVVDHEDISDYSIVLQNGVRIKSKELIVSKRIKLQTKTNVSFCHIQATAELTNYFNELESSGQLQ